MPKKDMKSALGASLKAEEQAVRSRFERADSVLGQGRSAPPEQQASPSKRDSKVIRDSFTIPSDEYELISRIKKRCMKGGISASKSEVLRAGLAALDAMPDTYLVKLLEKLPKVKTGRPPMKK